MTFNPRYIAVEGPTGVGKTTFAKRLVRRLRARGMLEAAHVNPFLENFYKDKDKYAFQAQMFFLLARFQQQQQLIQQDLFTRVTVSDYLFAKDRIFATVTLSTAELARYERLFQEINTSVTKPDLVIYLQAHLEVLLSRVEKRAQEYESTFDAEYLSTVCHAYNDYFSHYTETPLLVVNTSDMDLDSDAATFESLLSVMRQMKEGTVYYS